MMNTFTSGGLTLAYDDIAPPEGGRDTVVLVHGFATDAEENWRRLGWYGALERRGSRVVALDLRGHGRSEKPHDPIFYGVATLAADVIALMDHLEIDRADLMGFSLGARLAALATLAQPERVSNLILAGIGERLLRPAETVPSVTMAQAMRAPSSDDLPDTPMRGFRRFAEQRGEDLEALACCSEGLGFFEATTKLTALGTPTLVIAGARDELAGDPGPLASIIPGAKAVTVPACDHFSVISHALFKAAVFDFLDGWEQ